MTRRTSKELRMSSGSPMKLTQECKILQINRLAYAYNIKRVVTLNLQSKTLVLRKRLFC